MTLGGSVVKNLPCSAGDNTGSVSLISGSGRSFGEEVATHSSILAWEILWTEEPGGLQSMGSQRIGMTEQLSLSQVNKCYDKYIDIYLWNTFVV